MFISSCCCKNIPGLRGAYTSGSWKSKTEILLDSSEESWLPGCRWPPSHHILTQGRERKISSASLPLLVRTLIPSGDPTLSRPHPTLITSQRPPSSSTTTLGLQCLSLGGRRTPGQCPLCTRSPWSGGRCHLCPLHGQIGRTKLCAEDCLRTADTLKHILNVKLSVMKKKYFYYFLLPLSPNPQTPARLQFATRGNMNNGSCPTLEGHRQTQGSFKRQQLSEGVQSLSLQWRLCVERGWKV